MPGSFAERVRIVEVGPRDGLQNEARVISTAAKARYVELLVRSGLADIEVSSFVNPHKVPQLADADELFALIKPTPTVRYWALVANRRGFDRAVAAGVNSIALFTAASETFCYRNIGMSVDESLELFEMLIEDAHLAGMRVRGYISTSYHCPYEGKVDPSAAAKVAERLLRIGADELSIGDTVGKARPDEVRTLLGLLLPHLAVVGCHFHDTNGLALANIEAALGSGVTTFDASSGGIGGCPFAPGSTGNVSTEAVLGMMAGLGVETGVDLLEVQTASSYVKMKLTESS